MENKDFFAEVIETNSWADSQEDASFIWDFKCFVSGNDDITTQFLSIPYHQDFYIVMKDYCNFYEKYMLKMFSEKWN